MDSRCIIVLFWNNIIVVDWPAYSPNLNPIENIWAYKVKDKWEKICFNKTVGDRINKDLRINIARVNIEKMWYFIWKNKLLNRSKRRINKFLNINVILINIFYLFVILIAY